MTYDDIFTGTTYGWSPAYPGSTPPDGWNTLTVTFPGTGLRRITELKTSKAKSTSSNLKGFEAWCVTDEGTTKFYFTTAWTSMSWKPTTTVDCR